MRYFTALTAAALTAGLSVPALAEGDAAAGEKVYKRCKGCHAVGEGARNRAGPQLNGIVGAEIASVDGFKYSKAFMNKKAERFERIVSARGAHTPFWSPQGDADQYLTRAGGGGLSDPSTRYLTTKGDQS